MGTLRVLLPIVGALVLSAIDCEKPDANHIYFHGNGSQSVIFREFDRRNVKFFMYNSAQPKGFRLRRTKENLRRSGFNRTNPTKFLVHGYIGSLKSKSIQLPKNAYLTTGEFNVVAVDWSEYAFPYAVAVNSARDVGNAIGDLIRFMRKGAGLNLSDAHVVGHSLGAHIAGFAGKRIRKKAKKGADGHLKVARITGLDPAAPAFIRSLPSERLDAEDAAYVDVIHTSTRLLGLARRIGHADFYPAGGTNQPGCAVDRTDQPTGLCDHGKSYVYFARSIRNRHAYPAVRCRSVTEAMKRRCSGATAAFMGEEAVRSPGGVFYVQAKRLKKERPQREENLFL